jgi:hypothetical protein
MTLHTMFIFSFISTPLHLNYNVIIVIIIISLFTFNRFSDIIFIKSRYINIFTFDFIKRGFNNFINFEKLSFGLNLYCAKSEKIKDSACLSYFDF